MIFRVRFQYHDLLFLCLVIYLIKTYSFTPVPAERKKTRLRGLSARNLSVPPESYSDFQNETIKPQAEDEEGEPYYGRRISKQENLVGKKSEQIDVMRNSEPSTYKSKKVYDVLIIGAGWSGLGAAQTLKEAGLSNFIILEAQNDIGGVCKTVRISDEKNSKSRSDGLLVDLGPSWIHGTIGNPLFDYLKDYEKHSTDKTQSSSYTLSNPENMIVYDPDGNLYSSRSVDRLYEQYWESDSGFMAYQAYRQEYVDEVDKPLSDVVKEYIEWAKIPKGLYGKQFFNFVVDVEIMQEYAANTTEMSLWWWDNDKDIKGTDVYLAESSSSYSNEPRHAGIGYSGLVDSYAKPFVDKIQLNSKVIHVDYTTSPIQIQYNFTSSSSHRLVTLQAKKVISTLPIGVLKAKTVRFTPTFGSNDFFSLNHYIGNKKQSAIDKMQNGVLDKIVLYWDNLTPSEIFWPRNKEWIGFVSKQAYLQGKWSEWYYPYWKTGDIPMLVGFIVADHAKQMEGLTDKEVTESAMKQLRAIFHNTIIPEPTESIFTRWYQNEYSFGSYSVPGVGIHGRARKHLSAPLSCFSYDNNRVEECLFFAGEATNVNYPGTTHGALLSGQKAGHNAFNSLSSIIDAEEEDLSSFTRSDTTVKQNKNIYKKKKKENMRKSSSKDKKI